MSDAPVSPNLASPRRYLPTWRFWRRLTRIVVAVYLGLCMIGCFSQDWMLFPGMAYQGKPETAIHYGPDTEIVHLTIADGTQITAVFGRAQRNDGSPMPDAAQAPTIVYFYGNGGSIAGSETEYQHFRRAGANVLIPDFPGYGASGGKPSEAAFYATADACWDYLLRRPGIDSHHIISVGWSLGAGVAIDLAHRKPVAALATFNAFTTLHEMAHRLVPWLPTSLMLKYRFDNLAKIREIHCATFICNGDMDTLIPPEMSDRLAAAAGGKVTRLHLPAADHNSIFVANGPILWPAFGRFVSTLEE